MIAAPRSGKHVRDAPLDLLQEHLTRSCQRGQWSHSGSASRVFCPRCARELRHDPLRAQLHDLPFLPAHCGWWLLLDVAAIGWTAAEASARLLAEGRIAATPMTSWGDANADRFVRFVFGREPVSRLASVWERLDRALPPRITASFREQHLAGQPELHILCQTVMSNTSRPLRRCAAAVLALAFIGGSIAWAQALTADAIIARYVDARGGLAQLTAIRSIMYRGVYQEGTFKLDNAVLSLMRPYYKLVGDPMKPPREFTEGYDGSAWEFYEKPGVVLRTVGAASAAGRHAVYIDGPLVGYKERGWAVSVEGTTAVGERTAYRLRVRMTDGYEEEELIDTASWLLIAERKSMAIHAFGDKVASESRLSDFRPVNGVLFPFTDREVEIATGKVLNEMHYSSITANLAFDAAAFSPPMFVRTPLQAWVEQLYAERADVSAVLWSYRDFRVANPGVDTHEAVEFIGYQILKMGDVHTAIDLLRQNSNDYPGAATAAFGLGRAHRTAGDVAKAKAEFIRALELDPQYRPAKQALDAINGSLLQPHD